MGPGGRARDTVPRYWYHNLNARKLNAAGAIEGYPLPRGEHVLAEEFRDAKVTDGFVYIAPRPLKADTALVIDIKSIADRVRLTGQAEGYAIIHGDVPADCVLKALPAGQKKISKEEILDYLSVNGVKVRERIMSSAKPDIEAVRERIRLAFREKGYDIDFDPVEDEIIYLDSENDCVRFEDLPEDLQAVVNKESAVEAILTEGSTRYAQYQLPEGADYKELLLTIPTVVDQVPDAVIEDLNRQMTESGLCPMDTEQVELLKKPSGPTFEMLDDWESRLDLNVDRARDALSGNESKAAYVSSHWDDVNVIAHARFNTRTDADGRKVLFVEEIQGDKGQRWLYLKRKVESEKASPAEKVEFEMLDQLPFNATESWVGLVLKRLIAYAAEAGMDKIACTTGEQQVARYNLRRDIRAVEYKKNMDGSYWLRANVAGHGGIVLNVAASPGELESVLGKETAARIFSREGKAIDRGETVFQIDNLDIKTGGEGMRGFYDRVLPSIMKRLIKKLGGGEVETVRFTTIESEKARQQAGRLWAMDQPGFTITSQMHARVEEGMPMFSRADSSVDQDSTEQSPDLFFRCKPRAA